MGKKQTYYPDAEKMFVENGIPVTQISRRLEITEKTLREWKAEGEWDRKRLAWLKTVNSCNVELHKTVNGLAKSINDQIEQGNAPDPQMVYALNSLASTMLKVKTYEDTALQEEISKKEDKNTSPEDLIVKVQDMLGV